MTVYTWGIILVVAVAIVSIAGWWDSLTRARDLETLLGVVQDQSRDLHIMYVQLQNEKKQLEQKYENLRDEYRGLHKQYSRKVADANVPGGER